MEYKPLKSVVLSRIPCTDINVIFSRVQQEVGNKSELVNVAYQILQNQIFYMINLDITVLELCELIQPKAVVKSTGTIKINTPENVNCLFTTLNEVDDSNISNDSDESH